MRPSEKRERPKLNFWHESPTNENILVGQLTYVERPSNYELAFSYSQEWLSNELSFALTKDLPLQDKEQDRAIVWEYLLNLMPEGAALDTFQFYTGKRKRDLYSFLLDYGRDNASAFIILEDGLLPEYKGDKEEIFLSKLKEDNSLLSLYKNNTRFSLAGAQDKIAIIKEGNQFFAPKDCTPTNYIVKAYKSDLYPNCVLNEYLLMKLASRLGLNVPYVELALGADKQYLLLVERYDRSNNKRLQQIDLCQYHGVSRELKYEEQEYKYADKGLELKDYFDAIASLESPEANKQMLLWLCYNYAIGNTDCHAKNVSLLYKNNKWELAPFYDLLNVRIYDKQFNRNAFYIGNNNLLTLIDENDFTQEAKENNFDCKDLQMIFAHIKNNILKEYDNLVQEESQKYGFTESETKFLRKLRRYIYVLSQRLDVDKMCKQNQDASN